MVLYSHQLWQLLQLPLPQLAQPPPSPAIGAVAPNSLLERQAKSDNALPARCLHTGHSADSLDRLIRRINSNLFLQLGQIYS